MSEVANIINAITALAWPIIVAILLWKTFPFLKDLLSSRAFTVELGNAKLSVQEATQMIADRLEDAQRQIVELNQPSQSSLEIHPSTTRDGYDDDIVVLWCDDKPSNNTIEAQQLEQYGFKVFIAISTEEAVDFIVKNKVDIVISDMGRREGGLYQRTAGLLLNSKLKERSISRPFFIYSAESAVRKFKDIALREGVSAITSSPIELLGLVKSSERLIRSR